MISNVAEGWNAVTAAPNLNWVVPDATYPLNVISVQVFGESVTVVFGIVWDELLFRRVTVAA